MKDSGLFRSRAGNYTGAARASRTNGRTAWFRPLDPLRAPLCQTRNERNEGGSLAEFRDIVGFHAQQAAEKYLKALLTRHQIEFPKTHVIRRLLILLEPVDLAMVEALDDANWLSPFGAEIRYPGEEVRARQLAQKVRDAVMSVLDPTSLEGELPSGQPRSSPPIGFGSPQFPLP